jgi:hypothetical protein
MPQPDDGPYIAPARRVLDRLHRKDPDTVPGTCPATGDPHEGWTVCGSPMLTGELWVAVEYREGDKVCGVCEEPGQASDDEEPQEATLW